MIEVDQIAALYAEQVVAGLQNLNDGMLAFADPGFGPAMLLWAQADDIRSVIAGETDLRQFQ